MRIAVISPTWEAVPPPAYGGIEAVVSLVVEGLVHRGHDVTLYATGDSVTSAHLKFVCARPLRYLNVDHPLPYQLAHASVLLADADQFDIIHNHCGEHLMAFSNLTTTPMLTTIHGPLSVDSRIIWDRYTGFYNTISHASRNGFPDHHYLGIVYNGIDVESFPFQGEKEDYLLFLGRVSVEKGTHLAIQVARSVGKKLIIAGKVDRVDRPYFDSDIAPWIDGTNVIFFGEANAMQKRELFARARCLLHPVTWPEPFGLVMAEAMACGTPVIGFRRGSVPELVRDGETGFVVDTVDELAAGVARVHEIDPKQCRAHVATTFSAEQMVHGYERLYHSILERHRP